MSGNVKEITAANFNQEVIESEIPVLVDFCAEWCGPCKQLAPTVAEVADTVVGKVKVCKMIIHSEKFNICKTVFFVNFLFPVVSQCDAKSRISLQPRDIMD